MSRATVFSNRSGFGERQSRCALRKIAQTEQMPIVDKTAGRRVGAHRRYHDSILEFYATQCRGSEQQSAVSHLPP
jgi:hypothetical protein